MVITLILVYILKNAWALAWGYLGGNVARCLVSFIIHPYRPKLRLEFSEIKELLNFCKWIFGSGAIIFFPTRGDDIVVGRVLGLTALCLYQMAYTISNLPTTEITHVVSQIAFPVYSKFQDDLPKLRDTYSVISRDVFQDDFGTTGIYGYYGDHFVNIRDARNSQYHL